MLNLVSKIKLEENKYLILGHLTFFVLFIFALVFVNERILFLDSGAQVFELIRDEGFEIYAERYSMYLFQLFPVLAIKLHLPLFVVICAYSLSVPIIGYILWLITVYCLKNQRIGILILFIVLGIRHTFYHAISETFQLMFFAFFLYAWLFQATDKSSVWFKILYYFVACFFITLCVFIHPVAAFFIVFVLGMYVLDKQKTILEKVIVSIMSLGLVLTKILLTESGSYDTRFILSAHEFLERLSNIFVLSSTRGFAESLVDFYWIPLAMFIVSLSFYLKKKKYWYFSFLLCFVLSFWLISVILYANDNGVIARERTFLPLFFFCGIPFMIEIFPLFSSKWNKIFLTGLAVFIVIGFTKVGIASLSYTKRLEKIGEISALANQEGKKKLLITRETSEQIFSSESWGLGFESIMYSSRKGIDSAVNMFIVDEIDYTTPEYKNTETYLAVPWWVHWDIDKLNPHYFKLPKQPCSELVIENGKMVIKDL